MIQTGRRSPTTAIPLQAGIGLRAPHYRHFLEDAPAIGWLEVHSENYFSAGGPALAHLDRIRQDYPLSFHGVGLSLGSCDALSAEHLTRLKHLVRRFEPALVSEHLSWSSFNRRHTHDLLPLPHTSEAAAHIADRISLVQDFLGREILVENISTYLAFDHDEYPEWEFVGDVLRRAGCGLLLDVNNVYVNSINHGFDARPYIDALPAHRVREVHLAGHTVNDVDGKTMLIDTHNRRVAPEVWDLYRHTMRRIGPRPTLIEWDADLPALEVLLDEARVADELMMEERHAIPA
jgi:uncharacterized protein (UPF0276 family)